MEFSKGFSVLYCLMHDVIISIEAPKEKVTYALLLLMTQLDTGHKPEVPEMVIGSVPAEQAGRLPQCQKVITWLAKMKDRNKKRNDRDRMYRDALYNRGILISSSARRQRRGIAGPIVQD